MLLMVVVVAAGEIAVVAVVGDLDCGVDVATLEPVSGAPGEEVLEFVGTVVVTMAACEGRCEVLAITSWRGVLFVTVKTIRITAIPTKGSTALRMAKAQVVRLRSGRDGSSDTHPLYETAVPSP